MFNLKNNKLNWKELIFYLFFYFNSLIVPAPLVLTNFLSLLWWKKTFSSRFLKSFLVYIGVLVIYFIVHISNGVQLNYYLKSLAYFILMYFSVVASILFIERFSGSFSTMFRRLNVFGFFLFIIGCLAVQTPFQTLFWEDHSFTGKESFIRYMGLGYEASFYAYTLSPIIIYFLLKTLIITFSVKNCLMILLGLIPVIFSFSFGFFGGLIFSLIFSLITLIVFKKSFPKMLLYPFLLSLFGLAAIMSTDNFLKDRVNLILKGEDQSINGRTVEAFFLATEMAKEKSIWFGIGPGQVKVVGERHIRPYYNYPKKEWPIVNIPNACAETLAVFGVIGLTIRLGMQLYLFITLKVYRNYFQFTLFWFLFTYQFMGGYITSTVEYTFWVIAFMPIFKEFDIPLGSKKEV